MRESNLTSPLWWIPTVGGFIALMVAAMMGMPQWLGFTLAVPLLFCAYKAAGTIAIK